MRRLTIFLIFVVLGLLCIQLLLKDQIDLIKTAKKIIRGEKLKSETRPGDRIAKPRVARTYPEPAFIHNSSIGAWADSLSKQKIL
ncbi:MAG: hypothetical protein ONB05_07655 [candidate division KSB1 bacterium]|nr:hypothetical protein [candidate division KSB1 bacterium]